MADTRKNDINTYLRKNLCINHTSDSKVASSFIYLNGQVHEVEYIKKFSRKNNQYFWVLKNPEDEQYFPKYRNCEE